jgi:hypothetical protein
MPTDVFWVRQELRGAAREPVEAEAQQLCGAGVPGALLTGVGQRDRQGATWVHVPHVSTYLRTHVEMSRF